MCATVATGASAKNVRILDAINLFSLNAAKPIVVPVIKSKEIYINMTSNIS